MGHPKPGTCLAVRVAAPESIALPARQGDLGLAADDATLAFADRVGPGTRPRAPRRVSVAAVVVRVAALRARDHALIAAPPSWVQRAGAECVVDSKGLTAGRCRPCHDSHDS